MSAVTFTRQSISVPNPRVTTARRAATVGLQVPTHIPARTNPVPAPAIGQRLPEVGHARACAVPRAQLSQGLTDRSLLAIMVVMALVFLFGLVVMVQGFWIAGQPPAAASTQPAAITVA